MEAILTILYSLLFIFFIHRWKFFDIPNTERWWFSGIFIVKILCGITLWAIYSFYYTNRATADIFKFYDDALVLYELLFENPSHYLQILSEINTDSDKFHYVYNQMYHWYTPFETNFYNVNRSVIKLNAIICLFSFTYFNVHTVFFCFFSLLGLTALFKFLSSNSNLHPILLLMAVFLPPSVMFWGSGVLKEGIILFALGMLVYHFDMIIKKGFRPHGVFFIILSTGLLLVTKLYLLVGIVPGLIAFTICTKYTKLKPIWVYFGVWLLSVSGGWSIKYVDSYHAPQSLISIKQKDFYNSIQGGVYLQRLKSDGIDTLFFTVNKLHYFENYERDDTLNINFTDTGYQWHFFRISDTLIVKPDKNQLYRLVFKDIKAGSIITIPILEPTLSSFAKAVPLGFITTLLRPIIFEANSLFLLMAGFENLFLILLTIATIVFYKKGALKSEINLLLFSSSIVFFLFSLTGITTPVMGAMVRYKMPALPFLIVILLMLIDFEKVKKMLKGTYRK